MQFLYMLTVIDGSGAGIEFISILQKEVEITTHDAILLTAR